MKSFKLLAKFKKDDFIDSDLEHASSELDILEQDLKLALRGLNVKKDVKYWLGKKKRPLFLVLGAETAGKTTLLVNSGLNLTYFDASPYINLLPTRYCQWCFANEAVFIDAAGSYTTSSGSEVKALNYAWRGFIKLLAKVKNEFSFAGVVLVIDLPHMALDKEKRVEILDNIRERIYELARVFPSFPIHLVFSKMDLVYGFNEFFSDLGLEESSQLFGIDLSSCPGVKPSRILDDKFKELLKKLHERFIWRLHQERQENKRFAIQNFPLELEALQDKIVEIVNELPSSENIPIASINFVSSIRKGEAIDYLEESLTTNFVLQNKKDSSPENFIKHSYFVNKFFEYVVSHGKDVKEVKKGGKPLGRFFITLAVSFTLVFSAIFYFAYKTNMSVLDNLATILGGSQNIVNTNVSLNKLQDVNALLQNDSGKISLARALGFGEAAKVKAAWRDSYVKKLRGNFIPELKDNLEAVLLNSSKQQVEYLYSALKAYLMFGDKDHFDAKYIRNWFASYWQQEFPENSAKRARLLLNLNRVLKSNITIKVNKSLVNNAKKALSIMPKEGIVYTLLLSHSSKKSFEIGTGKVAVFNDKVVVPKMFTASQFEKTYKKVIPHFAGVVFNSDWVLAQTASSNGSSDDVVKNVRELYLRGYAKAWANAISSISVNQFSNLGEAASELAVLSGDSSPLLNVIKKLQENTGFSDAPKDFTNSVTSNFTPLTNVNIVELKSNLKALSYYFATLDGGNADKNAFLEASKIMQNKAADNPILRLQKFAETTPEPLRSWLTALSDSAWQVMLQSSRTYINKAWQKNIASYYNDNFKNRYPFFKSSRKSVSIKKFNNFFAVNGIMDKFFKQYVEPFVDVDEVYWQWKSAYNHKIGFDQKSLEMFMRAALIQKMFYETNSNNPSVSFTLQAERFAPKVQSLELSLGKTVIMDSQAPGKVHRIIWRGEQNSAVSLHFYSVDGRSSVLNLKGPWAWFKLLDRANLEVGSIKQRYHLIFDLNGNSAKYILIADKLVNPFIPGVVSSFRCKGSL